jgi:hypothetical protein
MTPAKKSALAQLEELRARIGEAKAAQRKVRDDESQATAAVKLADEALIAAIDTPGEKKATEALAAAEERAREPWRQREEAAKRRVQAAEGAVEIYIRENLGVLSGELGGQERKLRSRIQADLEDMESALNELIAVDSHRGQLVYVATGAPAPGRVSDSLNELRREIKRALQSGAAGARRSDPTVRTAA